MTPKEMLDRQGTTNDPLVALLIATVLRLHSSAKLVQIMNEDEDGSPIIADFDKIVQDDLTFINNMEKAGLFKPMILKVQVPISSNDPNALPLVYNEDRSIMEQMRVPSEILEMFEDSYKIYVNANLWADGTLQMADQVDDQPW